MSTQVNQYLIWGAQLPYEFHEQWEELNEDKEDFYTHFEEYIDTDAFKNEFIEKNGISCLYDGRDGKFIFLGRIYKKTRSGSILGDDKPLLLPFIDELDQKAIKQMVRKIFQIPLLDEHFNWYIVTMYR